ncbi:UDP-N-acetylmuramoyl-L-alanine--D-glutamate ligase [bacterium]|nr:UDP-N-acetylmuramoyl-L-alanine--D-glutamate ligase [bacterium]
MVIDVKNKRVTILGASRSGLGAAKLISGHGGQVFVTELASEDKMQAAVSMLNKLGIKYEFGGHSSSIYNCDFCVISPGISISSPVAEKFRSMNISLYSELEVASWFFKGEIIAVTGSNGKSTVTALTGEILKRAGIESITAGNIGTAFSEVAESVSSSGYAVVEVSSFQLEAVSDFRPHIGIFLNLTADHLNRHGTMDTYGKLKAGLFKNQTEEDIAVFNGDDEGVKNLLSNVRGKKYEFGLEQAEGRAGYVKNNILTVIGNSAEYQLADVSEIGIKGVHNVLNCLAASIAGINASVDTVIISEVLKTFKGLPHRMEFVEEIDGVKYYNDSKATNVDSVRYALTSFKEPVVLIAGGRDKDSDFSVLETMVKKHVRKMLLIGEAAEKMEKVLGPAVDTVLAESMEEAVYLASVSAEKGDAVLLSPACASFDMFRNFEDRGDKFKDLVRKLKK